MNVLYISENIKIHNIDFKKIFNETCIFKDEALLFTIEKNAYLKCIKVNIYDDGQVDREYKVIDIKE